MGYGHFHPAKQYPGLDQKGAEVLYGFHFGAHFTPEDLLEADRRVLLALPNFGKKRYENAIAWARANIGNKDVYNVDVKFAELMDALGHNGFPESAISMMKAMWKEVPHERRNRLAERLRGMPWDVGASPTP